MAIARRLPSDVRRRQIVRLVRREPCCTAEEIGQYTRLGRAAVRLYLHQLQEAGKIKGIPSTAPRRGQPGPPPLVWIAA